MKKRLLIFLTVLIVVMMGLTAVACTDYLSPEDKTEEKETVTRTQLITNGTFYNVSSSSDDVYVKTPTSWTATKGSLATTANGVTMGAIDLANTSAYNVNKSKFAVDGSTFDNPGVDPRTPHDTDDDGNEIEALQDTNALLIANNDTAGSVYYKNQSTFTLEAGKYYLLQYSVCTKIDLTDVAEEDQAKKGAWVVLTNGVEYVNSCINTNGEWKTYSVYIESNKFNKTSIDLRLWLGNGPEKINDVANVYATRGAVLFDNITCVEVTKATDADYNEGAEVDLDHQSFGTLSANAASKIGYVSAYYLSDLGLTQISETYNTPTTTNAIKYFYSFREGSYSSNNANNYTLVLGKEGLASADRPTVTTAFTGVVDLSKLYGESQTENAYQALLGTSYKFGAPSYTDWNEKIMNGVRGDLSTFSETKALMIYHNDLSGAGFTNKSKLTIEKNVNYVITVWAYVWAPYNTTTGLYEYPNANAPTQPSAYTNAQADLRDFYRDETDDGELFYGYFDALTAEQQAVVDGTAPAPTTAVTDINTLVDTAAFVDAVKAAYGNNAYSYFKYKYLKENFDAYVTNGSLVAGDEDYVNYKYLTERSNFLKNTWPSVKTLIEKWDKYYDDELTYNAKFIAWENNNDRPYAKVKLTGAGEDLVETTQTYNAGWEKIEFYVTGNQLSSRSLTLEFWFGEGSATEYENLMFGGVFFDNISIVEVSDADKAATYGDKDWKILSPLSDESELEFGGLIDGQNVADHWTDKLAENVAKEDKDSITLEYVPNSFIGSVSIAGVPVTLQELVLTHGVETASVLTGADVLTIKKNTAYRLALWVKTAIEDSGKNITVTLLGGDKNVVSEMASVSSVTSFNSDEWKEIAFYILGDSQVENYVALQMTVGSGTRYSTDDYVKGEVHLAVINCAEIKYSEYSASTKSGDEVKSYAFTNTTTASDSVTNGSFSSIDYSKTSVDSYAADGSLKEGSVATLSGWTTGTAKNNTFNTLTLTQERVTGDQYKLSWEPVVGIDVNGADTNPTAYEVYAKFTEDGEVVERLYQIVPAAQTEVNVDLTGIKSTSFRVRAVSDTAVSEFSKYVTLGTATPDGGVLVAKDAEPAGKKEVKAGSVSNEGLFAGSDYVSPYKTALMISSNYSVAQSVTAGDKSLSASSYYYISVWVKTVGDAKAAVTVGNVSNVLTADVEKNYIGFADVNTAGKWTQYGFYIKTGTTSTSFGLELSLGNPYAVKASKKIGESTTAVAVYKDSDLSSGTVYFDAVKVLTVTEAEYEAALEKGENTLLDFDYLYAPDKNQYIFRNLVYTADSFDSFTLNTTTEGNDGYNLGNTPNNYTWSKAADATGSDEDEREYGVYNHSADSIDKLKTLYTVVKTDGGAETNVFEAFMPEDFLIRDFIAIDGYNSLVMSNKVAYGQNYVTSNTVTINATTYYKVTFKAKTLIAKEVVAEDTTKTYVTEGVNGEFRFMQNGNSDNYQSVLINTSSADSVYDAVEYTLYIYNPSSTSSTAKWGFFLGDNADEKDTTGTKQLLLGMMVIDQVSMETVDEATYTAAKTAYDALSDEGKSAAATKVYSYPEDKEDDTGDDEGDDDEEDNSNNKTSIWDRGDAWLLISSIVIAVVIVIVVVVVLIRRWKKKHPREVVVENNVSTDKKVKIEEDKPAPAPVIEPIDEDTEEYSDVVEKPVYVQRVVRKDKKKKK